MVLIAQNIELALPKWFDVADRVKELFELRNEAIRDAQQNQGAQKDLYLYQASVYNSELIELISIV